MASFRDLFIGRRHIRETRDPLAYRDNSRQIEAFRICDFNSAMDGVFEDVITDSKGIPRRFFALVERIAQDAAEQYIRAPRRRFLNVDDFVTAKLESLYKKSNVNNALLIAQQKAETQNSVILSVEPSKRRGQLKIKSWIPGEVIEIKFADPLETDLAFAEKVVLEVPVAVEKDGSKVYGQRVYTAEEAYIQHPARNNKPEYREGIFSPDLSNPFGFIPLVLVSYQEPPKGQVLPSLRLDLLTAQEALCVGLSDALKTAQDQSAALRVLTGPGATKAVYKLFEARRESGDIFASDQIMAFDSDEDKPLDFGIYNAKPDTKQYLDTIDKIIEQTCAFILPQNEEEVLNHRARREAIWRKAEQELLNIIGAVVNWAMPSVDPIPDEAEVVVDHLYIRKVQNDLQAAQSTDILAARGLISYPEIIARDEGLDIDEAKRVWKERITMYQQATQGNSPNGLDRIAKANRATIKNESQTISEE